MEEIFKQYSTPIIIVVVVVAILAIVGALLATDGIVATAFSTLLTKFMAKAGLN